MGVEMNDALGAIIIVTLIIALAFGEPQRAVKTVEGEETGVFERECCEVKVNEHRSAGSVLGQPLLAQHPHRCVGVHGELTYVLRFKAERDLVGQGI